MHYLVTGATGLVGSHLVERLLERGDTVRALVRSHDAAQELRQRGVDVRMGDITEDMDYLGAVASVDVVIHCAAVVRVAASREEVWEVNVNGTRRLLDASVEARVPRFVYISSVAVYGHAPPPVGEDAPKRSVAAYGESKWASEQRLFQYNADNALEGVAIRPCVIYGPRDRHAWQALSQLFNMRMVPLPGGGRRLVDLVYVSDVVEAILAAATTPVAVGRAYNITDGRQHSWRDLLNTYRQIAGRSPTIIPVPGPVLVGTLRTALRLMQLLGARGDWRGQVDRLRAFDLDIHYAIDAARRDLGYEPQVGLAEGMRRTWEWDRQRKTQSERQ